MDRYIPIARAARVVAPISDGFHQNRFESGQYHVLEMLGSTDIAVEAATRPPAFPRSETLQGGELSKEWFYSIHNQRNGSDYRRIADWNAQFINWMRQSLLVCHSDIRARIKSPSCEWHAPIEHVDTSGASWNFPETLAWVATRDPLEVAQMRYSSHWEAPIRDDDARLKMTKAMIQNDRTRSRMIGWLVLVTAGHHCTCGSVVTDEREAWETCQCVGNAYDELSQFASGTNHPIPEYQPRPTYAEFTLTWPDGSHNLRFRRSEILEKWPVDLDVSQSRKYETATRTSKSQLGAGTLKGFIEGLENRDSMNESQIWTAAKAAYPNNSLSRSTLRQVRGPQKRGPKRIRQ